MTNNKSDMHASASSLAKRLGMILSYKGAKRKVAEICHVTSQAVTGWLKTGRIKKQHLSIIADYFEISLDWLLTGKGPMCSESNTLAPRVRHKTDDIDDILASLNGLLEKVDCARRTEFARLIAHYIENPHETKYLSSAMEVLLNDTHVDDITWFNNCETPFPYQTDYFRDAFSGQHRSIEGTLIIIRGLAAAGIWTELSKYTNQLMRDIEHHGATEDIHVYAHLESLFTDDQNTTELLSYLRKTHRYILQEITLLRASIENKDSIRTIAIVIPLLHTLKRHHIKEETSIFPLFSPEGALNRYAAYATYVLLAEASPKTTSISSRDKTQPRV